MKKIWFGVFLLAGVLLLASCAGSEGPQGPQGPAGPGLEPKTQTFDIYMWEQEATGTVAMEGLIEGSRDVLISHFFRWEPRVLVAFKGDTIVLNVSNPTDVVHGLEIPIFRVDTGPLAPEGGEVTVEFVADRAGTFEFRCSTPYDAEADPQVCQLEHDYITGTLIILDR